MLKSSTFAGVRLPRSVRFFDVRNPDDKPLPKAPWGQTFYASERAAYEMGLLVPARQWCDNFCITPVGCQTYTDARTCKEAELAKQIRSMRAELARQWREYRSAKRNPAEGGGVAYPPAFVALANYGWSLCADSRTGIVHRFGA